jgi:hypothetical protein
MIQEWHFESTTELKLSQPPSVRWASQVDRSCDQLVPRHLSRVSRFFCIRETSARWSGLRPSVHTVVQLVIDAVHASSLCGTDAGLALESNVARDADMDIKSCYRELKIVRMDITIMGTISFANR